MAGRANDLTKNKNNKKNNAEQQQTLDDVKRAPVKTLHMPFLTVHVNEWLHIRYIQCMRSGAGAMPKAAATRGEAG